VPAEAPVTEHQVVVTGSRDEEDPRRAPVRVDVVTRREAERRGATNVAEALSFELRAQVNPSVYGSLGNPSAIQLGGFDLSRVLILEDGERIIGDVGGGIDLAQLSLADVSRLELVLGPSSALYGTSALGGVLNIVTSPPDRTSGSARAESRSRSGLVTLGSASFAGGALWATADGSYVRGDGVALDPSVPDLDLPHVERGFVGARVGARLHPRVEGWLRVRYQHDASRGLESQEVPGLGLYLVEPRVTTHRASVRARLSYDLGAGRSLSLSWSKQWFASTTLRDRSASELDDLRARDHTMQSGEAILRLPIARPLSLLAGARAESETFAQRLERKVASSRGVETSRLAEVPTTTLGSFALYAQAKLDPLRWMGVSLGARVEGGAQHGYALAPRLALVAYPTSWLTLRAGGGRGYRAPSAKEVAFAFDHSGYGYQVEGNPTLSPESSWGLTADAELRAAPFRLRLGAFGNWVDGLIDLQLDRPGAGEGGVDVYHYVNVGRARTFGGTAELGVRASSFLRVQAGYSFLYTRDDVAERPLPSRPPHTALAALFVDLPHKLSLVARARLVSDAYLADGLRTVAFATADLRLARRIGGPGDELFVGALNLLDAKKDPRRVGDQRPLEGRTLYVGFRMSYPFDGGDP
jgi:outer membrane receptor for ferrienterochelin and colicins